MKVDKSKYISYLLLRILILLKTYMSRNIHVRKFTGESTPVTSKLGRLLINSNDSKKISHSLRKMIKSNDNCAHVTISEETVKQIKTLSR